MSEQTKKEKRRIIEENVNQLLKLMKLISLLSISEYSYIAYDKT